MIDPYPTIDEFRAGTLDIDCRRMSLRRSDGSEFAGPGHIRMDDQRNLVFTIYSDTPSKSLRQHFEEFTKVRAGEVYTDEMLYELEAVADDGTVWRADKLLPPSVSSRTSGTSVDIVSGRTDRLAAEVQTGRTGHAVELTFFEELPLPANEWTENNSGRTLDTAKFELDGRTLTFRAAPGSSQTTATAESSAPLPPNFDYRLQETVQYVTGKPTLYSACIRITGSEGSLELGNGWPVPAATHLDPPLHGPSFRHGSDGIRLMRDFLNYVTRTENGTLWNYLSYQIFTAAVASAGSIDSWALGLGVAVEAIAELIEIPTQPAEEAKLATFLVQLIAVIDGDSRFGEFRERARNHVRSMSSRRAKDTLHYLAGLGRVADEYVSAWGKLRNRQAHPKPIKSDTYQREAQKLFVLIRKIQTLMWQLTFHLIGYEGNFTDYGKQDGQTFPTAAYPLAVPSTASQSSDTETPAS